MAGRSTEEILREMSAGDLERFEALYDRLAPQLLVWLDASLPAALSAVVDAEDLLQEAWLRGLEQFARFDPARGNFRRWMFGISKNILLEAWRELRDPLARAAAAELRLTRSREPIEAATRAIDRLARDETYANLRQTVRALPAHQRELVRWLGLEGMTAKEASQILDKNPEAVTKAWQRLRQSLAEQHPQWSAWWSGNPD